MITIVAEKPDVGSKIAAALDKITLAGGKEITFASLKKHEAEVKKQQAKDGYLKIRFMGQDCIVTWGYGHLCELKQIVDYNPSYKSWRSIPLPFIPEKYEIQPRKGKDPKWDEKTKRQLDLVGKFINKSEMVVNATDYDREGEVIFSYIYEINKCRKPVKRACFTSQTKEGIQEAFDNLKDGKEMVNIDAAGRMRGIADWLIGVNMSIAMTLKHPGATVYSIGRVQTPTLNMMVEREQAIRGFKSTPYWTIEAEFTTPEGDSFKAKHKKDKIESKKEADDIMSKLSGQFGIVEDIMKKKAIKEPPLLYSLSALQMEANSKFGLTLSRTLEIAQKLYDEGLTTYPRTKSQYLTEDMEPVVNKTLDALTKIPEYEKLITGRPRKFDRKHYFDDTKVESHFAIIPTGSLPSGLSKQEANVYDLICKSVIRMLYGSATIENTKITLDVVGEKFNATGSVIVDPGWMTVGSAGKEDILPSVSKGDDCYGEYELKEKKTEPPKRYTDKTILAAMLSAGKDLDDADLRKIMSDPKTGGIGTEATRAAIIETLLDRGYIERNGKALNATDKGIDLITKLPVNDLKSAEMTARWEQRLNGITAGTESVSAFLDDITGSVRKWVSEVDTKVATATPVMGAGVSALGVNCPVCGKPMLIHKWGYGCSGYHDGCKFRIGELCGKKLTENQARMLISKGETTLIKGFVSKSCKKFDAILKLDAGKITFHFPK